MEQQQLSALLDEYEDVAYEIRLSEGDGAVLSDRDEVLVEMSDYTVTDLVGVSDEMEEAGFSYIFKFMTGIGNTTDYDDADLFLLVRDHSQHLFPSSSALHKFLSDPYVEYSDSDVSVDESRGIVVSIPREEFSYSGLVNRFEDIDTMDWGISSFGSDEEDVQVGMRFTTNQESFGTFRALKLIQSDEISVDCPECGTELFGSAKESSFTVYGFGCTECLKFFNQPDSLNGVTDDDSVAEIQSVIQSNFVIDPALDSVRDTMSPFGQLYDKQSERTLPALVSAPYVNESPPEKAPYSDPYDLLLTEQYPPVAVSDEGTVIRSDRDETGTCRFSGSETEVNIHIGLVQEFEKSVYVETTQVPASTDMIDELEEMVADLAGE